jgi:Signal transduction histidine kinase
MRENNSKALAVKAGEKVGHILVTALGLILSLIVAVSTSSQMAIDWGSQYINTPFGGIWVDSHVVYTVVVFIVLSYATFKREIAFRFIRQFFSRVMGQISKSIEAQMLSVSILSVIASAAVFLIIQIMTNARLISISCAILVFIFVTVTMVRKKTGYIREIISGIHEISGGNLDYMVEIKGNDELRDLAGNINQMSVMLKDKIEDEKRAEKTKNELITNMSHDLKTPLTTIIGYLTLINDKNYESPDVMEDYVGRAYSKSLKLKKLIEDLFEYTKLSNGVMKVNKAPVNLVELMEQQLGEMSVLAKQNKLVFERSYSENNIQVNVDSDLMARAFENILSNAIKYSYRELSGSIRVKITKNAKDVTVVVENEGDTIPTELLPLLFERFYRVDASRNSRVAGSGLGLAIAKSIVGLHGGSIFAESESNLIRVYMALPCYP